MWAGAKGPSKAGGQAAEMTVAGSWTASGLSTGRHFHGLGPRAH